MPAGVVVVKRTRRRTFALVWAVLAWMRSLAASLRGTREAPTPRVASIVGEVRFPRLAPNGVGATRCTACGECGEVCPSGCLSVTAEDDSPGRFSLDPGACIGCGRCVERCPEAALVERAAPAFISTGPQGVEPIDLLREAAVR